MERKEDSEFTKCVKYIMSNTSKEDKFLKTFNLLNIKQDQLNVIHVSGTNGKSSVSYKVSQCLISQGKTVGLFTSPHIFRYNERIRFQGKEISDEDFVRIFHYILKVNRSMELHFFSFILLIALVYFVEKGAEWIVLETGIGGLLDSTNFIKNTKVVVISSIGYDHMEMLGSTLDEIAYQKAGTIKKGSVVVLGPNCHKDEIFENIARDKGARVIKNKRKDFKSFDEENTETSRMVIEEALGMGPASKYALSSRLPGRMEVLSRPKCESVKNYIFSKYPSLNSEAHKYGLPKAVIMDIAHNETAIRRLCSDVFKAYSGNVTFCLAISFRRRLTIFNPIGSLPTYVAPGSPIESKIYYLDVNHDYCRKLHEVEADLEDPNFSPNIRDLFTSGMERSSLICSSESGDFYSSSKVTNNFDKVLYNAFIECCKSGDLLVLTGTAYMMENVFYSFGLDFNG